MDKQIIRKCLFPAAGYGTRFLPATKSIPKEMLPILTKPLIQYGVEEAIESGISNIAIVTSKYKKAIEDHFDTHTDIQNSITNSSKEKLLEPLSNIINSCTFSYTRQLQMKGLGHAILTGETLISNEPFAVILADDLCYNTTNGVLDQMIKLYEKYPNHCIVALEEVPKDDVNKYGIVELKSFNSEKQLFKVVNMIEKPSKDEAPSNMAIIGRYILTPDIFDILRETKPGKGGEIQITDALLQKANRGEVLGYKFNGKRFDCGSIDGFVEATNFFYKI
jgi:UTP--glucose-1-phosphate uridylyltransferase